MKIIETMEINELKKKDWPRYKITAREIPGGEFEATIQVISKVIVTDLGPFLPGSVALALLDVIEGLRMEVINEQKDTGDQSA